MRGDISRESSGGSGLGLAITKKIIELHKGTIILNSYEGVLDKVFEEFVRGDISRESSGGSGLGLAITKKIIELHKGTIILNSYEGVGSEFKIILKK